MSNKYIDVTYIFHICDAFNLEERVVCILALIYNVRQSKNAIQF